MSDLQSDAGTGGPRPSAVQVEMFARENSASGNRAGKNGTKASEPRKRAYGNGLKALSPLGKNFVLDTNVLLHDPDCLDRFADNHICIPLEVLCELPRIQLPGARTPQCRSDTGPKANEGRQPARHPNVHAGRRLPMEARAT